jgi:hypothetical protein
LDYLDERARPELDVIKHVPTRWQAVPERLGEYAMRLKEKTLADLEKN